MVTAAIVAEEEYKSMLYAGVRFRALRAHTHTSIANDSLSGHVPLKPAPDGRLPVHPLVLHVEPATLQAATSMSATRDASVDRCPPAATLQTLVGGWSGRSSGRGPSARPCFPKPTYPRPEPHSALATALPPVSAHVGYNGSRRRRRLLMRQIAVSSRIAPWKSWTLAYGWGKCSTAQPPSTPTYDRHTQGSYWYVRGHARVTHGHARARYGHARANQGHARATQAHTNKSRSESEPKGFYTQEVRTPLVDNHAPSGWLLDRGKGLRTQPWYQDAALRTSPVAIIQRGGLERAICEQHRLLTFNARTCGRPVAAWGERDLASSCGASGARDPASSLSSSFSRGGDSDCGGAAAV